MNNTNPLYLIETSPARILKVANKAVKNGADKEAVLDRLIAMKTKHTNSSKFAKYADKIHHKANNYAIDKAIEKF